MRMSYVRIRNFKTIKDVEFEIREGCLVLVGENNVGKSNILSGLDMYFNHGRYNLELIKDAIFTAPGVTGFSILVTFEGLSRDEEDRYKTYTRGYSGKKKLEVSLRYSRKHGTWQHYSERRKRPMRVDMRDALLNEFAFQLIPAVRDPNQMLSFADSNLLKDLLATWTGTTAESSIALKKLQSGLEELDRKVLEPISVNLNKGLAALNPAIGYKLKVKEPDYQNIVNLFTVKFEERSIEKPAAQLGTGLQNSLIMGLFKAMIESTGKRVILAYEEPEAHLHPQAQRKFLQMVLQESKASDRGQIIYSTHSPFLISTKSVNDVLVVRKISRPSAKQKIETLAQQVSEDFIQSDLADKTDTLAHGFREALFARGVILVEGKSNENGLLTLAKRYNIRSALGAATPVDFNLMGITVLPMSGCGGIKVNSLTLREFGIPFMVICDRDALNRKTGTNNVTGRPIIDEQDFPGGNVLDILLKLGEPAAEIARIKDLIKAGKFLDAQEILLDKGIFVFESDSEIDAISAKNLPHFVNTCLGGTSKTIDQIIAAKDQKILKDEIKADQFFGKINIGSLTPQYARLMKDVSAFVEGVVD